MALLLLELYFQYCDVTLLAEYCRACVLLLVQYWCWCRNCYMWTVGIHRLSGMRKTHTHTRGVCLTHRISLYCLYITLHCIHSFVAGGANFWGVCHLPWNMQLRRSVHTFECFNSHPEFWLVFLVAGFMQVGRRMYEVGCNLALFKPCIFLHSVF